MNFVKHFCTNEGTKRNKDQLPHRTIGVLESGTTVQWQRGSWGVGDVSRSQRTIFPINYCFFEGVRIESSFTKEIFRHKFVVCQNQTGILKVNNRFCYDKALFRLSPHTIVEVRTLVVHYHPSDSDWLCDSLSNQANPTFSAYRKRHLVWNKSGQYPWLQSCLISSGI